MYNHGARKGTAMSKEYKEYEGLMLESTQEGGARPIEKTHPHWKESKVEANLADGMVGNFRMKCGRGKVLDVFISVLGHSLVVAILILIPLLYTNAISMPQFEKTLLVAPPPPPPPPPPPAAVHVMPRVPQSFFNQNKLFAPQFIPKKVEQIKEQAVPSTAAAGVVGGVVGGVPGGQLGGVLGGILGGSRTMPAPPPPKPAVHKGPYRVGGRVQAPQLIRQVQPTYPTLAKQARIQGDVVVDSVIDAQGRVTQMRVVSGSPLLVEAAMQALAQWRYQPTLLNGQPVDVEMLVTMHFQLGD